MNPLPRAARVVLVIAIGLLLLAAAFLWLHIATPSDGARLKPGEDVWRPDGVVVTPIEERSGSLRNGDVVAAVEGRSMESWARAIFQPGIPRPRWHFGQSVTYTVIRDGQTYQLPITLVRYPLGAVLTQEWGTILFALVSVLVAAFVFLRRADDPAARALFLSAASIACATTWSFGLQVSDLIGGAGFWLFKATTFGAYMLFFAAGVHFALFFSRAHPFVLKRPGIVRAVYVIPYAVYPVYLAAVWPGASSMLDWLGRWVPGESALAIVYLMSMVVVSVWNYRVNRDGVSRQKMRWVALATLLSGVGGLGLWLLPGLLLGHPIISTNALGLLVLPYPLAIAVAIMRHHLFDIDVIINRTLVYGALTAVTMGIYIFIVGYLGDLLQARDRTIIAFLAAGLVAVIFQPLRERLQRAVNRLTYGERDDPYAVLSRLGQRLEATLAPEAVLPTIVETVAQALKLPCAAIALKEGEDFKIVAASPPSPSTLLPLGEGRRGEGPRAGGEVLPLVYQGEIVGQLIFSTRAPGEAFTVAERRLLEDIAHQAGVAVHAVRLTADLQRARERLVTAREEERRRLRRNLHDGLGPALAAQTLKVGAARALSKRDPAASDALLAELERDIDSALADIRRLVYDLRPPALDELGLVGAIRESVTQYHREDGLRLAMDVPAQLPTLPAAVEVAAYRITQEALTNVVRHARARHGSIRLTIDDGLRLEVCDDGVGLPPEHRIGVGLTSMHERAEELGGTCVIERRPEGGTRVAARLPINF